MAYSTFTFDRSSRRLELLEFEARSGNLINCSIYGFLKFQLVNAQLMSKVTLAGGRVGVGQGQLC